MIKYFIHNGKKEEGPFNIEQLKLQALKKDTPIWYEGCDSWKAAAEVEELKSFFPITPPPFINKSDSTNMAPSPIQNIPQNYTSYEEDFPTKKSFTTGQLIIAGVIVFSGFIGWLVYQNSVNASTINNLQEQVSVQDTFKNEMIQGSKIAAEKEAEKEINRKKINTANTLKNMNYRNNWETYIKTDKNEPKINYTLGGIDEFNVFLQNDSEYMLDQVNVIVRYIRKNGSIWQTSTVRFLNVPPNSTESLVAPSSLNGVKVSCTIEKIISKKMHFCYPSFNGNLEDPYFCK